MQSGNEHLQRIGSALRKKRTEKGMSQQELADISNIAKSTVQRIENGELNPTILMLITISEALEVEVIDLITPL
jgi:transcriptional regulator with XRE-family HTH domain